jgi:hypothetical protein
MGTAGAHQRKARHNNNFLQLIQRNDSGTNPTFPDWMVTVAFYIALHYVDAKLASLNPPLHPRDHSERNYFVSSSLPRAEARSYLFLKSKSEFARYFPDSEKAISTGMIGRCVSIALTAFV